MYKPDWKLKVPTIAHKGWNLTTRDGEPYEAHPTLESVRRWMLNSWMGLHPDRPDNHDVLELLLRAKVALLEVGEELEWEQWVFTIRKVEP